MLDLSLMRSVFVDPEAKVAVADGGCLACDVDAETALHRWVCVRCGTAPGASAVDCKLMTASCKPCVRPIHPAPLTCFALRRPMPCSLATPLGICSVVGVGGLALNGGLSLLSRALGATCDNILEIQMVLADGSVVSAASCAMCPALPSLQYVSCRQVSAASRSGCQSIGCRRTSRLKATPSSSGRPGAQVRGETLPASCDWLPSCYPSLWPHPQMRPFFTSPPGTALGIATKLKLRLHDVSGVYCGALVWPDDPKHDTFRQGQFSTLLQAARLPRALCIPPCCSSAAFAHASLSLLLHSASQPPHTPCRGILRWVRDIVLPDDSIGFNLARAVHPEMGPVLISMVRRRAALRCAAWGQLAVTGTSLATGSLIR